jgi:hypothetical protein
MAVEIPDDNREPRPVGIYSWDFATSICCDAVCGGSARESAQFPTTVKEVVTLLGKAVDHFH